MGDIYSYPLIVKRFFYGLLCALCGLCEHIYSRSVRSVRRDIYSSNAENTNPRITVTTVVVSPGSMKLWLSRYLPTRVLPVLSKLMAAMAVG